MGLMSRPDILSDQSIKFMTDNDNGFAPVGWKGTVLDGTWWITGSFPGYRDDEKTTGWNIMGCFVQFKCMERS